MEQVRENARRAADLYRIGYSMVVSPGAHNRVVGAINGRAVAGGHWSGGITRPSTAALPPAITTATRRTHQSSRPSWCTRWVWMGTVGFWMSAAAEEPRRARRR